MGSQSTMLRNVQHLKIRSIIRTTESKFAKDWHAQNLLSINLDGLFFHCCNIRVFMLKLFMKRSNKCALMISLWEGIDKAASKENSSINRWHFMYLLNACTCICIQQTDMFISFPSNSPKICTMPQNCITQLSKEN